MDDQVIGRLHADDVAAIADAIAVRFVEILDARPRGDDRQLVSAVKLAPMLGVEAPWVRAHKHELGGIPMGDGPKPRWGFDPVEARERLDALREPPAARGPRRSAQPAFPPVQGRRPTRAAGAQFPPVRPRRPRKGT
jgi:hypothetical protein